MDDISTHDVTQLTKHRGFVTEMTSFHDVTSLTLLPAEVYEDHQRITATDQTLTVIYILISALGLLGNCFVIGVIFQYTSMRKGLTNLFIINQSIIDGVSSLILLLTTIFDDDGVTLEGLGGDIYCKVWLSKALFWSCLTVSTTNLLAMTLERFAAIVYPIKHKMYITLTKVMGVILFSWAFGFAYNSAILMSTSGVVNNRCNVIRYFPNVSTQKAVGIINITIKFFIPLAVICYCYTKMVIALKNKVYPAAHTGTGNGSGSSSTIPERTLGGAAKKDQARRNVVKTLLVVSVCFAFCWVWNQMFFLVMNLGYNVSLTSNFYHFTVVAVYLNCCCNPFIYIIHYRQFQEGVRKLKGRFTKGNSGVSTVVTVTSKVQFGPSRGVSNA